MRQLVITLLIVISFVSCSNTYSQLQEIESYIEEDPKRALEEIRNINTDNLQLKRIVDNLFYKRAV